MRGLDKALKGSQSRGGVEVLAREEANYCAAIRWAAANRAYDVAYALGDTLLTFLQRSGRLREQEAWVAWLAGEVGKAGFTEQSAALERDEAWSLLTQGHPQEAIQKLEGLVERLRTTTRFDSGFQLATSQLMQGRVLNECGLSERAVPILEDAIRQWEALVEKQAGRRVIAAVMEVPMARGNDGPRAREGKTGTPALSQAELQEALQKAETDLCNLSAAIGDLATALRDVGRLDEALEAAEKGMAIDRRLGRDREVAASHGQCASILMAQGRYSEADARYDEALAAARRAGDKGLEGSVLQHQGSLADNMIQLDRAASLYQSALKLFQDMNDDAAEMRTCNLLGVAEQNSGRLAEARAWYERSREIALRLGNTPSLGGAAHNIGIVCQMEGEAALRRGDETTARARFEDAKRSLEECLRLWKQVANEPDLALSYSQLAQVHLLLGDLAEAERHAHQAREIRERLGLKEVFKDYHILAEIAHARGDSAQAAEWERKRDTARAELDRRAQGAGGPAPQLIEGIQQLSLACAQAGFGQAQPVELGPDEESALAELEKFPAPFPDVVPFLRRLAARDLVPVPAALPPELRQFLQQLVNAAREAGPKA